jgi:hypothetical protein
MPLIDSAGGQQFAATGKYVGNFGPDWSLNPDGTPRGVFGPNNQTCRAGITDGTSNTIFVGERAWQLPSDRTWYGRLIIPTAQCDAAIYYGVGGDGSQTFRHDTLGIGQPGVNNRRIGPDGKPGCAVGMSSLHLGGTQVAMGDAKVEFLSDAIDPTVMAALMDKADGRAVRVSRP